jgi:hypothetical protein
MASTALKAFRRPLTIPKEIKGLFEQTLPGHSVPDHDVMVVNFEADPKIRDEILDDALASVTPRRRNSARICPHSGSESIAAGESQEDGETPRRFV